MKRLTLDKTWVEQLKMSGWVAEEAEKSDICVRELKEQWLEEHNFGLDDIEDCCFFCEYTKRWNFSCSDCPGIEVDKGFDCQNPDYHYFHKPVKFYKKLVEMNKIRKKRSRK